GLYICKGCFYYLPTNNLLVACYCSFISTVSASARKFSRELIETRIRLSSQDICSARVHFV
ncbi:unnamed protein product, partial [Sphagnum jensenii]